MRHTWSGVVIISRHVRFAEISDSASVVLQWTTNIIRQELPGPLYARKTWRDRVLKYLWSYIYWDFDCEDFRVEISSIIIISPLSSHQISLRSMTIQAPSLPHSLPPSSPRSFKYSCIFAIHLKAQVKTFKNNKNIVEHPAEISFYCFIRVQRTLHIIIAFIAHTQPATNCSIKWKSSFRLWKGRTESGRGAHLGERGEVELYCR